VFERFTERARQVVVLAQEEARGLKHNYIGTEHLLLGLLREQEGLAARVLESLDITVERVRAEVERIIGPGEELTEGQVPFTPRAKKVLELALRECKSLGHNYIGTEHILLGLARENEGVAARILVDFDADSEKIRNEIIRVLSDPGASPGQRRALSPDKGRGPSWQRIAPGWLDGLGPMLDQLADEIRGEFGREPDPGDLLLVLTVAPQTIPAQALQHLEIDIDELWGQVEHLRHQALPAREQLTKQIEQTRLEKERAIEAKDFQSAARLRDQERELKQQHHAQTVVSPQALQAVRRRLGLPTPPHPPTGS
jgi:ATP-dependent Clp protease ATP-binding subunit ClpA